MDYELYRVENETWQDIENRVQVLSQQIENKTLNLEEYLEVEAIVKEVRNKSVEFNKALRQQSKTYKDWLNNRLIQIGFSNLEAKVDLMRKERRDAIASRHMQKMETFKDLLHKCLEPHPLLRASHLGQALPNLYLRRFPVLNSGAKDKDNPNWEAMKEAIVKDLHYLEEVFSSIPILYNFPIYSKTMQGLSQVIATGNPVFNLTKSLEEDTEILRKEKLKEQLTDHERLFSTLKTILDRDGIADRERLEYIELSISAFKERDF